MPLVNAIRLSLARVRSTFKQHFVVGEADEASNRMEIVEEGDPALSSD